MGKRWLCGLRPCSGEWAYRTWMDWIWGCWEGGIKYDYLLGETWASGLVILPSSKTDLYERRVGEVVIRKNQAFYFILHYWGLNPGTSPWATPPALFCEGGFFFWDRVLWTVCPGWLQTTILLISASARVIDVSHWCLAKCCVLY
jgi:hypothetical protein